MLRLKKNRPSSHEMHYNALFSFNAAERLIFSLSLSLSLSRTLSRSPSLLSSDPLLWSWTFPPLPPISPPALPFHLFSLSLFSSLFPVPD